jgi:hypothetical protein
MVVLGEAVCFVAYVLQQAQGVAVTRKPAGLGFARDPQFFVLLRQ